MNKFEKNVQSKNNDVIDSGLAFIVGGLAFTIIWIVARIFQLIAG